MARLCRQPCAVSATAHQSSCLELHGILTAKGSVFFAAGACDREFLDRISGSAMRDRDPTITEKQSWTRSSSQRVGGTRKAKGVSSRPHHVLLLGQLASKCLG